MATANRTAAKKKRAAAPRASKAQPIALLIATRKGAFILKSDGARRTWKTTGPFFLGQIVHHMVLDPRDRRTLLASTSTGHLGPTMMKSTDLGRTWKEVAKPPAFPKAPEGVDGRSGPFTTRLAMAVRKHPGRRSDSELKLTAVTATSNQRHRIPCGILTSLRNSQTI